MPLSALYQFAHCSMLYAGCATRWSEPTPEERAEREAVAARLRERMKRTAKRQQPNANHE